MGGTYATLTGKGPRLEVAWTAKTTDKTRQAVRSIFVGSKNAMMLSTEIRAFLYIFKNTDNS
jgi:hypothetical protein